MHASAEEQMEPQGGGGSPAAVQAGTSAGALVAVWLGRPRASAKGRGAELKGSYSRRLLCRRGQSTACREHSGMKGTLPLRCRLLGQLGT